MSIAINRLLNDFQQCLAELAVVPVAVTCRQRGVIDHACSRWPWTVDLRSLLREAANENAW